MEKNKKRRRIARMSDHGVTIEDVEIIPVCDRNHATIPVAVADLPFNQKQPLRHRCAGCAYKLGYREGYNAALNALRNAAPPAPCD